MTFLPCNTVCLSLPAAFLPIWVSTLFFPFVWERLSTGLRRLHDDGRCVTRGRSEALITAGSTHVYQAKPETFRKYPWSHGFSHRLKVLSIPARGRYRSCECKTLFSPLNTTTPSLFWEDRARSRCTSPKSEETYLHCSDQRNSPGTAPFSAGWPLVLVDILHFFSLSPVAAVANKSLSASAAWNCAHSSWRSPGAILDPASKNQECFHWGF